MAKTGVWIDQPTLIRKAGAMLRALTPSKIATLILIREGASSQREIADKLDLTPPAVSNYIETFETLPVPLVGKEGHDLWITDHGKHTVSTIIQVTDSCPGMDILSVGDGEHTVEILDRLEECLSPLFMYRSDRPYFVLYATGTRGSSGWMITPSSEPVSIDDITTTVKGWLSDSITRTQIRSHLRSLEDAEVLEVNNEVVTLTGKGVEQCQLLKRIMQLFIDVEPPEIDDDIDAAYRTEDGRIFPLPQSATMTELEQMLSMFKQETASDQSVVLVAQTRSRSTD